MQTPDALQFRVRSLESQNRVWKLTALVLLLVMVVSLARGLMAQGTPAPSGPTTVEAQSFVLKDDNGNVRGRLSVKGDQPSLELYDRAGKVIWSTGTRSSLGRQE